MTESAGCSPGLCAPIEIPDVSEMQYVTGHEGSAREAKPRAETNEKIAIGNRICGFNGESL